LRQMIRADVEGSLAGFFAPLVAGAGVAEALPFVAPSVCALFFFFAIARIVVVLHVTVRPALSCLQW